MEFIALILQIFGGLSEVTGVIMMAEKYLNLPFLEKISVLFSSLYRGPTASSAKVVADFSDDDAAIILRGLSFICLGFLLQVTSAMLGLLGKLFS